MALGCAVAVCILPCPNSVRQGKSAHRLPASRSTDSELLDPGVHRIHDVQATTAVQGQTVRRLEAVALCPLAAPPPQVLPRVRELRHAMVGGPDPAPPLPVDAQGDGTAWPRLPVLGERGRPEPAGFGTRAAPKRQELSFRRE